MDRNSNRDRNRDGDRDRNRGRDRDNDRNSVRDTDTDREKNIVMDMDPAEIYADGSDHGNLYDTPQKICLERSDTLQKFVPGGMIPRVRLCILFLRRFFGQHSADMYCIRLYI
jgi:hypothetical protein